MVHTLQKLKTSNLNLDFEFQQLLGSLKHVINIIMWIRDTGCYTYDFAIFGFLKNVFYRKKVMDQAYGSRNND